jgi:hypothetical protein
VIRETISELVIRYKFLVDLEGHNKNRVSVVTGEIIALESSRESRGRPHE